MWRDVPIGTPVRVTMDDGTVRLTRTRSAPWMLGAHRAVIKVDGIAGGYCLTRVALESWFPKSEGANP